MKIKEKSQANEQFNDKIKRQEKIKRGGREGYSSEKWKEKMGQLPTIQSLRERHQQKKKGLRLQSEKKHKYCVTVFRKIQKSWTETIAHVIQNATPRRKSMLSNHMPSYTEEVCEVLNLNRVGRPSNEHLNIKKKSAFTQNTPELCGSKRTVRQNKA